MYITNDHHTYHESDGTQHSSKGLFLILVQHKDRPVGPDNMRAIVRKVALVQFGHFMMGYARIKGKSITVSGSYGGDGLPVSVDSDIYDIAVPVPSDLYDAWAHGGGWNSSGSESTMMRKWAKQHLSELYNV